MDILFINPDVRKYNSLSLGYIAAYLRSKGFEAGIVDLACHISSRSLLKTLHMENPLMVGLAAYQSTMEQVISMAKFIKSNSQAKVVLGGPQIPGIPENSLLDLENVDYFCRGEAEITMAALLRAIKNGNELESVPGISFRLADCSIGTTQNPPLTKDLDEYPSPYLTGVLPPRPLDQTHILTSRGCSSKCSFCVTPLLNNGKYRIHSVERVVDEIQYLNKAKGVKSFWIADPDFMGNKNRVRLILEEIIRNNIDANFWCQTRAANLKSDLLKLMKKAGFHSVAIGVETINKQALEAMKKGQTAEDVQNAIELADRIGIELELFHILGCPGDTYDSILDTFDFIRDNGFYFEGNGIGQWYNLYFGSEVTSHPERFGITVSDRAKRKHYPSFLSPGTHYLTDSLSEEEKKKILIRWESEINLADLRTTVRNFKSHGMRPQKIVKLPFATIETVRTLLKNDFSSRENRRGDLDSLMIIENGGLDKDDSEKLSALIDRLNFSFSLKLISSKDGLSFLNSIVQFIVGKLERFELFESSVIFNFSLTEWEKNRRTLETFLKNFVVNAVPLGENESIDRPVTDLVGLLDLSHVDSFPYHRLYEIQNELEQHYVTMFPFVRFESASSFEAYIDLNRSIYEEKGNYGQEMVFMGLVNKQCWADLKNLYQVKNLRTPLPPLHIIDKATFISGEKPMFPNPQKRFCSETIHVGRDLDG